MALTLVEGARNAACDAIVDLIDAGEGTVGSLIIGTTALATVLVTNEMDDPAFGASGAVNPGEAVAGTIEDGTVVADGTAAEAKIVNKAAADVITGLTVGTSESDINLSSVTLNINDVVSIASMKATMPGS